MVSLLLVLVLAFDQLFKNRSSPIRLSAVLFVVCDDSALCANSSFEVRNSSISLS